MKRVIFDVPRWHIYLGREARGLQNATERDSPVTAFEDELFDRLYSGETTLLADRDQNPKLKTWAEGVHTASEALPAFRRLASECLGDPMGAGIAVETLMTALQPQMPKEEDTKPPETVRRTLGGACDRASKAVEEMHDAVEGMADMGLVAGKGSGTGGQLSAGAVRALAGRLRADPRLKQIAMLAGRFKRIAASKRRQRVKHGADEIADVELGADLGRLLPSELVRLAHPGLRLLLLKNLLERQVMQYQLVGQEPLGKGPLVVLLDKSGSMDGARDIWATALSLALLDQAQRERRTFALLAFDYRVKFEAVIRPGESLPEEALFTGCSGGTEISNAVARGLEIIAGDPGVMKKADVVLVTDGGSDAGMAPKLREKAQALSVTILGLGIGVEREWLVPWCDEIAAVTDLTSIDDSSAEKLFAA
jgi:uncharacterized protein with von Willebrand factor type A (vWA) domain